MLKRYSKDFPHPSLTSHLVSLSPAPGGAERPSVFHPGSQLMAKLRPPRPALEVLEDRCVPATVQLVARNLFISNQVGPVSLTLVANSTVKVQDNVTTLTFAPVTSILFTGTNGNDSVTLTSNGNAL